MPVETQQSIVAWADETFGKATDPMTCAARLAEEMREFLELYETVRRKRPTEHDIENLRFEAADVVIAAQRLVQDYVDRKMWINRARKWRLTGTGHGYHEP